jgi:hypothetical protein
MSSLVRALLAPALFAALLVAPGCDDTDKPAPTDMAVPPDQTALPDQSTAPDQASAPDMVAVAPTCADYCKKITASCTQSNAQYTDEATCNTWCTKNYGWAAGLATDGSGDTIGCRTNHAVLAAGAPAVHCPHAGPSGGNTCGLWCEVYCDLALRNCTGGNQLYVDKPACMTACGSFTTNGLPNAQSGNNVQCRIYHLGLAGTDAASATTHCPHGATNSSVCQ